MKEELRRFLASARVRTDATELDRAVVSLDELRAQQAPEEESLGISLAALRGRFAELSARGASATLTAAIGLVIEAQREREPVAWITGPHGSFYPPDVADSGVDLAALVVVRVPAASASLEIIAARAAERLVRSGAFGLLVIDLVGCEPELPMAHQGRLVTLAQTHDAAIVCLTEKAEDASSIGSLVSLRAEALRAGRLGAGEFELKLRVLKDKRRGPGWSGVIKVRGPAGT
jgi:recombination protein RecA